MDADDNLLYTTSAAFVDSTGRTIILRGVNLSGSSKAPFGTQSHILEGFWEEAEAGTANFVGRPLNIDDGSADEHLARLRGWGFNVLRFPVTWEAIEHAGPGKYDHDFIQYTIRVLRKCKEFGFKVYMDPHQDVWSRFTGGSGAPFWTLVAAGFDRTALTPTLASIVHQEQESPASIPAMIWGTNYARLAAQTLFTFFFGGRTFAPRCIIDGQNIQDYLQSHFINAMGALADAITAAGDLADSCVIGWDSMNEPHHGLIGHGDLLSHSSEGANQLKKGPTPTPAQGLRLGMGTAQSVEDWTFGQFGPTKTGNVTIDPKGRCAWATADVLGEVDGVNQKWGWKRDAGWEVGSCIWAAHGVWDPKTGEVLRPDYFSTSKHDEYIQTYWAAHYRAFAARMRQAQLLAILFVAPPVFMQPPPLDDELLQGRACYSTHYYDGLTLCTRHWNWFNADALGVLRGRYSSPVFAVKVGEKAIRQSLQDQLRELKNDALILGDYPTIIGEIGTPFDMDHKRSYGFTDGGKYKGDYTNQQKALDASLNAADGPNALNYTVWTYCPDNSHVWGDGWNLEDLSLWSSDDCRSPLNPASEAPLSRRKLLQEGSAYSLATLSVQDPTKGSALNSPLIPSSDDGSSGWDAVYDLLTNGARAVKAVTRPYPRAIIGAPTETSFDIAKAEFKMKVRVRAEDAPRKRTSIPVTPEPGSSAESILEDEDNALATEIYVPLVHYASTTVLPSHVRATLVDDAERDGLDTSTTPRARAALSSSTTLLNSGRTSASSPLDLDVNVSSGRWEADGQLLRWWYPVPAAGEQEQVYEIVVRRKGGAMKTLEELAAEGRNGGLCKEGGGCTVM